MTRRPWPTMPHLARLPVAFALAFFVAGAVSPARADYTLDDEGKWKAYGDFRLRFEDDWDSVRANGNERSNRARTRIRARLGFKWNPIPEIQVGGRLRSGSIDSQQSPHITIYDFSNNKRGDKHILPDKWFVKGTYDPAWAWAGRNGFPFWKQNELFWNDDVTPLGGAAGASFSPDIGKVSINAGFFALADGGVNFNGKTLAAGQVVYSTEIGGFTLTGAAGVFAFDGEDGAEFLRNGNGARDYTIWVGNLQLKTKLGGVPVKLGVDGMHNSENYSAADPVAFTAANRDETSGFVANVTVGQLKKGGDWLAAYYYAYIETLSVNASYAQDDWIRFGNANQTDSSDFKGHEFRLAYAIASNANLVARLYLVDAITSVQDGKRFRIDFNIKF